MNRKSTASRQEINGFRARKSGSGLFSWLVPVKDTTAKIICIGLLLCFGIWAFTTSAAPAQQQPKTTLVVKMAKGQFPAERQAAINRHGGTQKRSIPQLDLEIVEVPAGAAAAITKNLQDDPAIVRVETNQSRKIQSYPSDTYVGNQWALTIIGWDRVYGSVVPQSSATVAILDTGVDPGHPDLIGSIGLGTSSIDNSAGLTDLNGHGTWLAGIVSAKTDNGLGIAGVGFSQVQVMPVKVLDSQGVGQDDDIISGILWATDHGASVILMAFSGPGFSEGLQEAIDYAWSKNVVLVAATGNDGSNTATYPAGDRGVMGVSATDQSDNLDPLSNYGSSVFLAAPGRDILGTFIGDGYVSWSGTSASAAIVAGAAGLMRAVDPSLTNGIVVNRLARSADPTGTQMETGNGRVQLAKALADTSLVGIQPAGTGGNGGPFVGSYTAASVSVSVTVNGAGTGTVASNTNPAVRCTTGSTTNCSKSLATGTSVTLAATPNTGSTFTGWSNGTGNATVCNGLASTSCTFTLSLNSAVSATFGINAAPVITEGTSSSVAMSEDGSPTAFSLTLHATDPNPFDTLTWSISGAAVHGTATASGIGLSKAIGYTPNSNYNSTDSFTVMVSDGHGGTDTIAVNVTIAPVNDAPTAITDSNPAANTVPENSANGTLAGITALASDPDAGETISYSLTDSAGGRFAINPGSGVVTVADGSLLNYESATSHFITVKATDLAALSTTQAFLISVTNVNEPPTGISDSNPAPNTVPENSANGTVVGITALASDPDAGTTISYSLTDSAGGRFAINSASGVVTVANGSLLDYESASSHSITVKATDPGALSTTQVFTINLSDVVEPTVAFASASSSGSEAATPANLAVTMSAASASTVTVNYAVTGGTATGGGVDYTLANGTLTFNPGQTNKTIAIAVNNDTLDESDETVQVALSAPVNVTLGTPSVHTYTIQDNDNPPVVSFAAAASSGSESASPVNLSVSLSTASALAVTVNYAVTGGTATGGGVDYTLAGGTLTFNPGQTGKTIAIAVNNDTLDEIDETVQVTLSAPVNATLGTSIVHTYTIQDDDASPVVSFATASSSGSESASPGNLAVSLSTPSGRDVTVNYAVTGGTATGGGIDYTLSNGTLTFNPGDTSKTIAITVNNDTLDESDETVQVTLSAPVNATLGTTSVHTYTIQDDDDPPVVAFATAASSGSEAVTGVSLSVSLSAASGSAVTVSYAVTGGTATGGGVDYTLANGTLTFNPGETSKTIAIAVNNDTLDENDETVQVTLSAPVNATLGTTSVYTYTIQDDDAPPAAAFSSASSSASEAASAANLSVSLSAPSGLIVTVNYAVTGGTATGGGVDYTLANGTLTFNPGETSKTIAIAVNNDTLDENDETVQVTLSAPVNATLGTTNVHTYTIQDDDDPPVVAFVTAASSGSEAVTGVNLSVSLSAASASAVTVGYAATGGTATGGGVDYTLASGTLTFDPGETSKAIAIVVNNDTLDESDETVQVTLSAPANATLGTASVHTYTIQDDDDPPVVAFVTAASSGSEAVTGVNLSVSLSAASSSAVTVGYAATGGTATGGGVDYTLANGTLTFNPGETSKTIAIVVNNDTLDESDEIVQVTLSASVNATLGTAIVHTYTIQDDDDPPVVAFVAAVSSGSEAVTGVNLSVSLSAASASTVTVNYAVTGGTATGGGVDYTLANGMLTFNAGETSKQIAVIINDDAFDEPDETVQVSLSGPVNATLGTPNVHTYLILDNDDPPLPVVAFTAALSSGSEAASPVNLAVSLSAASVSTVTVNYAVTGGTATGGGVDYTLANGTLTFNAGETTKAITIAVNNDSLDESDETVQVMLTGSINATLGTPNVHTYTIQDDDDPPLPSVAFTNTASSGSESASLVNLAVVLSSPSTSTVTVNYAVTGTATGGGVDYTLSDGTLTFNPGETSKTIAIAVNNDTINEGDETVGITLWGPMNATLGTPSVHTYTIQDDDAAPVVAFTAASSSGSEAVSLVNLAVSLSASSNSTVIVNYAVTGTATGGGVDYTLSNGTLTFNPGETSRTIAILVNNDTINEADETVDVTLWGPVNATLGTPSVHTYTILDNDGPPAVAFTTASTSGGESASSVNLSVSLSAASTSTVTVSYAVTGGTATGGVDYTLVNGTLTFNPGQTSKTIAITVINDTIHENDETVQVTLSAPVNATLGTPSVHTYTIQDDDNPPVVAFTTASSAGSESASPMNLMVSLSAASSSTVTVNYAVTGGTAAGGGVDYTGVSGTLTFNPGETSKAIAMPVTNDTLDENDETVQVSLSGPVNATLGTPSVHTYTIQDDDNPPVVVFSNALSSASESVSSVSLSVLLSPPSGKTVTVNYAVTGGTAVGGGVDYTLANGTLTFNPGDTSKTIAISVINDTIDENDETVDITLSGPVNATLGTLSVHTHTILDNDGAPVVKFAAASSSGSEAVSPANLTVSLSAASSSTVTVNYTVTGTATGGGVDYSLANGTLTFNPGQTSKTIAITVINDTIDEGDEAVQVTLSGPVNATLGTPSVHTFTILDDDNPPVVAFTAAASSGGESVSSVTLSVSLSAVPTSTVTVNYTATGTATGGGVDYTLPSGTLTFNPGETSKEIAITINNDTMDENDETVKVTLSGAAGATLGTPNVYTYTILDDDDPSAVFFPSASAIRSEAASPANLPVSLSASSGKTVTVNYAVTGGTATGGGVDYTLANGTLTFSPGVTKKAIVLTVNNDTIDENDETVEITLSGAVNSVLGAGTVFTYTIQNDDGPTVSFATDSSSGSESVSPVNLSVVLSAASASPVTVSYGVTGGTATGGGVDYTLANGTLTFSPGETSKTIAITINDNSVDEDDETVQVSLFGQVNAVLGAANTHTYTIVDDDAPPTVGFTSNASSAGESVSAANLSVALSAPSAFPVTVNYGVTGGAAIGGGVDYTLGSGTHKNYYVDNTNPSASDTNPGTDSLRPWRTIGRAASTLVAGETVTVLAGGSYDEAVTFTYSGASGNPITITAAPGTRPTVRRFDLTNKSYITVSGFEMTNLGFTPDLNPSISLRGTTGVRIINNYIHDTTTNTAGIRVVGAKAFNLYLSRNTLNGIGPAGNRAVGMELWGDNILSEGNDISHTQDFTRVYGSRNVIRNDVWHDSSSADQPAAHVDGMQSFCSNGIPNEAASYLLLEGVYFHDNPGPDEHFALINGTNTCGGTSTVILRGNLIYNVGEVSYIADNNQSFGDHHKYYNNTTVNGGIGYATKPHNTVSLTGISYASVLNNIFVDAIASTAPAQGYTLDTSGTSSGDYNLGYQTTGSITWSDPINSEPHNFLNRNPLFAGGTDFHLQNGSPAKGTGGPLTTVRAGDSGGGTTLLVTDAHFFQDGWGGATPDWIAVGSSANPVQISSINYSTDTITLAAPIMRSAGQPVWLFKNSSGSTVLYGAAPDIGAFPFVIADAVAPVVSITTPSSAAAVAGASITLSAVASDNVGVTGVQFKLDGFDLKSEVTAAPYSVTWDTTTTVNGSHVLTAVARDSAGNSTTSAAVTVTTNNIPGSGTLTFNPGETSKTIAIALNNDALDENDETIDVTLSDPVHGKVGTAGVHTFTILDNDDPPVVAFTTASSSGSETVSTANLSVSLSMPSGRPVTVNYVATGGTAVAGMDYTLANGTLTFNAGETTKAITFAVNNDSLDETDETVQVMLSAPVNATLGTPSVHTYTILDNDDPPLPSVAFTTTASSGSESASPVNLAVLLSAASTSTITVNYAVTGTATGGGVDYTLPDGTLTFNPGETSKTIAIAVTNDTINEGDETVGITLWAPMNATLGTPSVHTYTILDDDDPPVVAFATASSSGSEAASLVNLMVSLSAVSTSAVTVNYAVTGTATGGGVDYTLPNGTLTFNPGEISKTIAIAVNDDALDESDETVDVTLWGPVNATLGTPSVHTYTILDNDGPPVVAFTTASSSGSESASLVNLTVSLSAASTSTVTVSYAVTGGTATEGTDYTLPNGTLTFNPGETTKAIAILVNNDTLDETDETVQLTLSTPVNATLGTLSVHVYTIQDDDHLP